MEQTRDWNAVMREAMAELSQGKALSGTDGIMAGIVKRMIETALDAELEAHLKQSKPNRRNGRTSKTVKTTYGPLDIDTSRDREGSFEPQLIKKRQTTLPEGFENQILSLFSHGMSYNDISEHMSELYGVDVAGATITAITDKLMPVIEEWRSRPLEAIYPVVFLDGVYFKCRNDEGEVVKKVAYSVIGIDMEGKKDVLGIYLWEGAESAKMWMQVLCNLKERGVKDIFIACTDNLTGFEQAIKAVFEDTAVQLCIVHQLRNTKKYLNYKDTREVMGDLKKVYRAQTLSGAEQNLEEFAKKWKKKYPSVVKSWQENWPQLSHYFNYSAPIRRLIYTTNTVEGYHRKIRQRTKTKAGFTSDKAILKILYVTQLQMQAKWGKIQAWGQILQQLEITFEQRLKKANG